MFSKNIIINNYEYFSPYEDLKIIEFQQHIELMVGDVNKEIMQG